jgi:alkylation response protein AidB-like acyl-CoA dehydrogenase
MRFAFTRDQLLFRDALRDVLRRECAPAVVRASWEKREAGDALWKTLAALGALGLTVPEEHGGLGLGALDWVLLCEEAGRFAAPVPLTDTIAIAVPLVAEVASEDFKHRWLPAIAKGEARVAVGLASSPFIRDADVADLLIVQRGQDLHVVAREDVTLVARAAVDGSRRLFSLSEKDWTGRREDGKGRSDPNSDLPAFPSSGSTPLSIRAAVAAAEDRAALAASAELLGLAARMIEMTVDYVKVRKQFGVAIGSFQAVKHHLATAHMKIELARPAVYRAAYSVSEGDPAAGIHVSMAKACASDAATVAARVSLQCHGAIGYSVEHDLHLWMKRAWALAAAWGDAAWHRARVAGAVIDVGSTGERENP